MAHVANVTIDHTKVPSNLTDFPVFINLADMPALFWSTVANGGGDIRCFKSDGTTELPREVVFCDQSTDTGEIHVKYAGTLSSTVDTVIQIHADGTSSDYAVSDTYGRNNVWKSGYKAVLHAQNSGTDSSGNGDWTMNGSPTYSDMANMGKGVELTSTAKYISRDSDMGLTSRTAAITMTSIQKMTSANSFAHLLSWGDRGLSFYYELRMENSGGWKLCGIKQIGSEERTNDAYDPGTDFHHFSLRFDGTSLKTYGDAVQKGSFNPPAGSGTNTYKDGAAVGAIAHNSGSWQDFGGNHHATEARFYLGDLGADWLTAEYNNLINSATFYTVEASSAAYTIVAALGTYTYTGVASNLLKSLKITASLGTYALIGISAGLMKGFGMIAEAGSYALTGIDAAFNKTLTMAADAGSYVLTGIAATLVRGVRLVADAGSYVLTGIAARLRTTAIWFNQTRRSTSYVNRSKRTDTWNNQSK